MAIGNLFNEEWYLANNPDVREAVAAGLIDAWAHFEQFGRAEGRAPSPYFDPEHYLRSNPDVAAAVEAGEFTAYDHFIAYGASEGRSPSGLFDPEFYLAQNPDVAAAVEAGLISATEHFLLFGQNEPRQINPFINLAAYLEANADLAAGVAEGVITPLSHLLYHGAAESRDLGNGINLGLFANDSTFQEAIENGNLAHALERVSEIAPFLPSFQAPAGWQPPADTPIPRDFTPPEGIKLVIPPSVQIPDDMELPDDIFEPVEPMPEPVDPTPPVPPINEPFSARVDEGVLTFTGRGDITVEFDGDSTATFYRGSAFDEVDFNSVAQIRLTSAQQLVLTPEQAQAHAVVATGPGMVKIAVSGSENIAGHEDTDIANLALVLDNGTVELPANKKTNLLVYPEGVEDTPLKTLTIQASGVNSLDLGNAIEPAIGYFLSDVKVRGSAGSLELSTLYFGEESTTFDSTGYAGSVHLDAYVYHGKDPQHNWSIKFGKGNDVLHLHDDPDTVWDIPPTGGTIHGGGGTNSLVLNGSLYEHWHKHEGKVENFQWVEIADYAGGDVDAADFVGYERISRSGEAGNIVNLDAGQVAGFNEVSARTGGNPYVVQATDTSKSVVIDLYKAGKAEGANTNEFALSVQGKEVTSLYVSGTLADGDGKVYLTELPSNLTTLNLEILNASGTNIEIAGKASQLTRITEINASTSSADLYVPLGAVGSPVELEIAKFGMGDDSVYLVSSDLAKASVSVDLGMGDDTFVLNAKSGGSSTGITVTLGGGKDVFVLLEGGNVSADNIEDSLVTITDFKISDGDQFAIVGLGNLDEEFVAQDSVVAALGSPEISSLEDAFRAVEALITAENEQASYAQFVYNSDLYIAAKETLIKLQGVSDVLSADHIGAYPGV